MKIPLKFAELHAPLFLAGTNLQMKLDPTKRTGLTLVYDRGEKELLVGWNGEQAIIPTSNVSSMTPAEKLETLKEKVAEAEKLEHPPRHLPQGKVTAQVETPQSHVHAGPGHGQTGQEKPKGKVVL